MTDFFVLPGTRVPLGDPGGVGTSPIPGRTAPYSNPELDDGGVVQVVDAEWARRAGVARELAAELADALASLDMAGLKNHYGQGVREGEDFYQKAKAFVSSYSAKVRVHVAALQSLASMCDNADSSLRTTDSNSARDIQA
ncbi:hypothetical protein ACPXB3_17210 [Gordonia sp. DT219]|uniref:hypothetical protein n=1 Tax=Gordonia sp. DT219 TaxID=3416658 RepID=UPI003CEA7B09